MDTDETLFGAYVRRGDVASVSTLVERHRCRLAAFLSGLLPKDDVEDVFQETWRRILAKAKNYRGGVFEAYLMTIARRTAIDHLRRRKFFVSFEGGVGEDSSLDFDDLPTMEPSPADQVSEQVVRDDLRSALRLLPFGPRQVVLLRIEGNLSFKEIATELNLPLGTVLTWMRVATERLRKMLGEQI